MRMQVALVLLVGATVSSAQKCVAQDGIVVGIGQDVGKQQGLADADACCAACNKTALCAAWTFHKSGAQKGACWMHSSMSQTRSDSTAISGARDGPLPPTPPPTPKPGWNVCSAEPSKSLPFCDTSLSMDARLKDLVKRINLDDAGAQLTARESPSLGEIGLPSYYWGTNAIHGMQNVGCLGDGQCPTSFPAPCALSAAWNTSLVKDMGMVIGRELRAYYNAEVHDSLDTWSPTINLNRDPRWGRNVESPGEDPLLCGEYGKAYTQGLQNGVDPSVRQATVTLKHWVAYSIESYNGVTRHNVDVNVSAYDLSNSYFPAWEKTVVEGGAKGVMCSYNMLNGRPTCGNAALTATLRQDWNFTGYITSDTDSCADIHTAHKFEPTGELATRDCLVSGTDIDSGSTYKSYLASAVQKNITTQASVDQALYNSYKMRFEMGLFDPSVPNEYRKIKTDEVGSAPYQAMSLNAARQAMTLLKNEGGVLPFATGKKVAVIGRAATDAGAYTGNYDGPLCPRGGASCWPGLCEAVSQFSAGNATCVTDMSKPDAAAAAAQAADLVILLADNAKDGGGEGHDRQTVELAADQQAVCDAVLKVGKPTALLLVNGGAISIDKLSQTAPAIVEAFMPGVHGAQAMAETVFGANNPGGKLPVTIYPAADVYKFNFLDMDMQNGPGRSYRYYSGKPLFDFGFGLSYTTFELSWSPGPPPAAAAAPGEAVTYEVTVRNTGSVAGDEVVQAFTKPQASSLPHGTPTELKRLFGFQRVHLAAGASTTIKFTLDATKHLALVNTEGHTELHDGAAFDVVFTRGHGDELERSVALRVPDGPLRTKTLRKWW